MEITIKTYPKKHICTVSNENHVEVYSFDDNLSLLSALDDFITLYPVYKEEK